MSERVLRLDPIGIARTPFQEKYEAPRQPGLSAEKSSGRIILNGGQNFEQALTDLEGFEKIWLIYWFDRNEGWKPMVRVPRGPAVSRGVFATRSPHRPNPIGISLVTLVGIRGLTLDVEDIDLLDKTPILDIKPYLPSLESWPEARSGWLGEIEEVNPHLEISTLAQEQLSMLSDHGVELLPTLTELIRYPLSDHPYRRTKMIGENLFECAIKSWRVIVQTGANTVRLVEVRSGYSHDALTSQSEVHDDAAHREFHKRYSEA